MDFRILLAGAFGLIAVAFGGFYFAFGSRSHDTLVMPPPARTAATSPGTNPPPAGGGTPSQPSSQPQASPPGPPGKATPESTRPDQNGLQSLLKKYFAGDYKALIAVAGERRNEGVSDVAFGQELFQRFQRSEEHTSELQSRF